jgi:calcium-dependent protein kinase
MELQKLGEGAYGTVRLGKQKDMGAVRAVKAIAKSRVSSPEKLKQEIAIMKVLDHPCIVKLFETFEDHRSIYLVMELCAGGELFDRVISAGSFTEANAANVMQQIMRAIFYMHESGVVHRDLKPENFLFLDKGPIETNVLKIIDFGLSRRREPGQMLTTKVGTPYYVAPQVLAGRYDHMCDIWSCGVIMFILLSGVPPFNGNTDAEILAKVRGGMWSFSSGKWDRISSDAKDLIRQMLKMSPQIRYDAEKALNHHWIKDAAPAAPRVQLLPGIVENLRGFRSQNKLKKAALNVIANNLNEKEIKSLRDTFVSLDENGDGLLTLEELKAGLANAGGLEIPVDLQAIMDGIDADGSGMIDYSEFLAATLDRKTYLQEDLCWAAFRLFDLDGDGRITQAELKEVLAVDGITEALGLHAVETLVNDVDKNGDGEIDFEEFMAMMKDTNGTEI